MSHQRLTLYGVGTALARRCFMLCLQLDISADEMFRVAQDTVAVRHRGNVVLYVKTGRPMEFTRDYILWSRSLQRDTLAAISSWQAVGGKACAVAIKTAPVS